MSVTPGVWAGRSVVVTGHTGFKGGWLSLWLSDMGARVHGLALDPPTDPSLFAAADVASVLASDWRSDVTYRPAVAAALHAATPSVVFHLAAQPLVRASYVEPFATFQTNVMGVAAVLDAVRDVPSVQAVVVVTTDKVYENREWPHPYRESDALGGHDPYSASKAAAELLAASWRRSFFARGTAGRRVGVATARAGNVIGGGDWAPDRLVPDVLRAAQAGAPLVVRAPGAVRPWQHVLDPLDGYLVLAERLLSGAAVDRAWNFGPDWQGEATVGTVVRGLCARLADSAPPQANAPEADVPHEAGRLVLDSSAARADLGWRPRWTLDQSLDAVVDWFQTWRGGAKPAELRALCLRQIHDHQSAT